MANPIEATPTLYGEDAKRLIRDVEAVNEKLKNPEYRKRAEADLERCEQLYLKFFRRGLQFSRKGKPIGGGRCFENS